MRGSPLSHSANSQWGDPLQCRVHVEGARHEIVSQLGLPLQSMSQLAPLVHDTSQLLDSLQLKAQLAALHWNAQLSPPVQSTPHVAPPLQRTVQSSASMHSKKHELSQLRSHASPDAQASVATQAPRQHARSEPHGLPSCIGSATQLPSASLHTP